VLFRDACAAVPADAVLLEVGPHAIMRSPLRQARLDPACEGSSWLESRHVVELAFAVRLLCTLP